MVHQYGDIKSCAPTLDEAVPMFAAIEFLQAKSNTDEGQALKIDSSPTNLLVTTKFIALTTNMPERICVYDRNVSSNEPVQVLSHARAYHHAVSGQYLVSLADDSFKVWDLYSGDVVQSVPNPESINHWDHGWNSVGFENHTVVVTNRKGCLQFWTSG